MAVKKNIKFEEALENLEACLKKLETADISLDDSIKTFEEAVMLVKICNDKLDSAERKVRILTEGKDGAVTDMPFDATGDEA
jgi:exodeoxyribonuclease VII small subunit